MKLYIHNKCSTCKEAVSFLEKRKANFKLINIVETPPSEKELESMLKFCQGNIKKLLNTSGNLYRELNLAEKLKTMTQQEVIALLSQHGMLIKRPFLIGEKVGLTGFKENEWDIL